MCDLIAGVFEGRGYECSAGTVCDLAEQSWSLKAGIINAVLGLCVT